MTHAERHRVEVTTAADGSAEAYTDTVLTGWVVSIVYTKPATGGMTTADFAITAEDSGINLWTQTGIDASTVRSPTQDTHNQSGVAREYAASGSVVATPIILASERIKIVVANGGNALSGTFDFIIGGTTS